MRDKHSKSEVNYGKPEGTKNRCGTCVHFISGGRAGWGSCGIVQGSIDPHMVCDLYKRTK